MKRVRRLMAFGIIVTGSLFIMLGIVAQQHCSTLDIDRLKPSFHLQQTIDKDRLTFAVHVAMARLFQIARVSPAQSGVEWVKAAAHARSTSDDSKIVAGLVADKRRTDSGYELTGLLCSYSQHGSPHVQRDIANAGFTCPS